MKKIIIIALGIVIFIIILLFITFLESLKRTEPIASPIQPSPTRVQVDTSKTITKSSAKKALEIAREKPSLSQKDLLIRNSMISNITEPVSVVYKTELVEIKYIKGPDDFEAKIVSINVNEAKNQTVQYFREKGLSDDGICKLPLVFYPSIELKTQLASEGKTFSLLPDFCL